MGEYHVSLPQGLLLTVEVNDTPIRMHITFPRGKRVTFDFAGDPTREATATITQSTAVPSDPIPATAPRKDPIEMAKHGPLTRISVEEPLSAAASPATNARIEYVDPAGSQM